jgi:hypothetical protein
MSAGERFGVNFANRMPKSARGKKMRKASLSSGTGPGSSISLAPETVRIRDALIEKFSGAPLEDMTNFMTMALSNETDELRRLGILAARIYILRHRVANLKEFNRNPSLTSLPGLDTTTLSLNLATATEPAMSENVEAPIETEQWSRIQMTEPGEVNGVRFLAGTIIDAQTHDADKLIRSGKAVRVDEDGNIIEHQDDDFTDSDADANASDEAAEAIDNDTSALQESDDEINAEAPQGMNEVDAETKADQPQEVNEAIAETEADQPQEADADEEPKAPTS